MASGASTQVRPRRFVQARNYTAEIRSSIDLIVLHSMESAEGLETAENVAAWFAGPKAPRASCHYCVDADSIVQCVREDHIAWHAPGANARGIGIEHAGRAAQTADQWADDYSLKMLDLSTGLAAEICQRWGIPPVIVDVFNLRLGHRGITTHAAVSLAFNRSTHWDPGADFPLEAYVETVAARLALLTGGVT